MGNNALDNDNLEAAEHDRMNFDLDSVVPGCFLEAKGRRRGVFVRFNTEVPDNNAKLYGRKTLCTRVTTTTTTTTIADADLDSVAGGLVRMNSKCHYSKDGISDERQFRLEGQATLEDCKARCLETSGCKFYSWTGTGEYAHVCMGCSDVKKFSEHQGFSLHALHRADLDSVSPVA